MIARNYLFLITLVAMLSPNAFAASVDLSPTADGDVQIFGGDDVDTTDTILGLTQSGGLARNIILEFDLSSIADDSTITSARIDFTLTRFVSQVGDNPAAIHVIAYNGDGTVDIADYAAAGDAVLDTDTPKGGTGGDVRSFTFDDIAPLMAALSGNLLTLRVETDSFASINIASLENATYDPVNLHIEFTPVPVPAALPLLLSAGVLLGTWGKRRRCI